MYLRNIFCIHLHTVPGEGLEELEKIFKYSTDYKKFRLTIKHASFVENYILDKLEIIEKNKSFFTRKDLVKILRLLEAKAYLTEVQSHDIVSFAEGDVPRHEIEQKKAVNAKEVEKSEDFGHEPTDEEDYDRALTLEAEEQKKRDADFERNRRYSEIRKMADDI